MLKLVVCCLLLAFSCAVPRGMADIVVLSSDGLVSGSGYAYVSLNSQSQSFSFSDPMSGSGSAIVTFPGEEPGYGSQASSQASAGQGWSLNGNSLSIDLNSSWSGSVEGAFAGPFNLNYSSAQAMSNLSLEVELTSTYAVQLSGTMTALTQGLNNGLLDDYQIATFDGVSFSNYLNAPCCNTIEWPQFVLGPGIYSMSADSSWSDAAISGFGNPHEFSDFAKVEFNADFTPVVPEPRWVVIPALLLMVIGSFAVRKHRAA